MAAPQPGQGGGVIVGRTPGRGLGRTACNDPTRGEERAGHGDAGSVQKVAPRDGPIHAEITIMQFAHSVSPDEKFRRMPRLNGVQP